VRGGGNEEVIGANQEREVGFGLADYFEALWVDEEIETIEWRLLID
jgi:hypothetical protein